MASYEFKCKDIGMKCDFEAKGASSREEMMQVATAHANYAHRMPIGSPEMVEKVSSAIKS
jgi:predicted small metal-binding protein